MPKKITAKERLDFLDYLRGYFVVIIIVDHLWRFPSLFTLLGGQAKLWMTAAEGFVIISGFLIGYVRGFKGQKTKFGTLAWKLFKRALILYIAMAIASVLYISIEWSDFIPSMPYTIMPDAVRDWGVAWHNIITMERPHTWVHFLALYARYLLLAIPAVWLLRKKQAWAVGAMSIAAYLWGVHTDTEWMKWQVLFFIPTIIGFYYEPLRAKWRAFTARDRKTITAILLFYFAITAAFSAATVLVPWLFATETFSLLDTQFRQTLLWPARVVNAFLWFAALAYIFHRITPQLKRYTAGVLHYIGTHSLQAYLVHGLIICLIAKYLPDSSSWFINTMYGLLAVLGVYGLIKLPVIRRILPR